MGKSVNRIQILGRVGADPELRDTPQSRVANFSVATDRYVGKDKPSQTDWHRVTAWNSASGKGQQLADVVEKYVKKGDQVFVEGRIEYRTWEDKDGNKKYATDIVATDITLLGAGKKDDASPAKPAKKEGLDDFPAALDTEDDDLPF